MSNEIKKVLTFKQESDRILSCVGNITLDSIPKVTGTTKKRVETVLRLNNLYYAATKGTRDESISY